MLHFPKTNDLLDLLLELTHRGDFSQTQHIERALTLIREQINHPWAEIEECKALQGYLNDNQVNLEEARRILAQRLRHEPLRQGMEAARLKDVLIKIIVPYLRMNNTKYIAQRQREKRSAESAI